MNNSAYNAHGDTPGKPESKRHAGRSLKGVDRLMRLLPFICPFKSSDLKASLLLLGYLLMTFVCDVMIRVSFEVHFPICMFLRFGKAG